MKLVFVRHGDPDYSIDSLTPKGEVEAKLLAERISQMEIDEIYVSTMGRAKKTASYSLEKMNRTAVEYDWLKEFQGTSIRPDVGAETLAWDWLPGDWTEDPRFYDYDTWTEPEAMEKGNAREQYDYVIQNLDQFLEDHGYKRNGNTYQVIKENRDTIVFFCHFGVTCVILSHLLHVSPMILWHGLISAPTGVTTVYTEERRQGIASFRVAAFGDISHLYVAGEEPAFAGRFCETYSNMDERHD